MRTYWDRTLERRGQGAVSYTHLLEQRKSGPAQLVFVNPTFFRINRQRHNAIKCGIGEDELRRDAFALLQPYDDMSVDVYKRQVLSQYVRI